MMIDCVAKKRLPGAEPLGANAGALDNFGAKPVALVFHSLQQQRMNY